MKLSRNSRMVAITKILMENPNKIIGLNKFSELLNAAKSTISEDLVIIREALQRLNMGKIDTIAGAAGGVKFINDIGLEEEKEFANSVCEILKDKERIVPGNFIFMTDLMYNPKFVSRAGKFLSKTFQNNSVDCVITVETKGIPLAYEVAKNLGVQLVIARRENKITEGSSVTINYVSGSSGRIQQMSLSKKSLRSNSKCIFIDDFMKCGGTAKGIVDLLKEYDSSLVGIGVLVDNITSDKKLIDDYVSIVEFLGMDDDGNVNINPSKFIK